MNVIALPGGPSLAELASPAFAGSRRAAPWPAAYGALVEAAQELLTAGTSGYAAGNVKWAVLETAFGDATNLKIVIVVPMPTACGFARSMSSVAVNAPELVHVLA